MEGFVAVTESTITPGYQISYFEIGTEAFTKIAVKAAGQQRAFRELLVGHICYAPRPTADEFEVIEAGPHPRKSGTVGITIRIKRGHYQMAEFLNTHQHAGATVEMRVSRWSWFCACSVCGEVLDLPVDSLPNFNFSLLPRTEAKDG